MTASATQLYAGYTPDVVVSSSAGLLSELAAADGTGGVIGVDPGNYSAAGTATRFFPAFAPAAGGTSGNPLVIVAKYPAANNHESPSLFSSFSLSSGTGAVLGTDTGTDYVRWIGMHIDQTAAAAQGSFGTTSANDGTDIHFERFFVEVADAGAQDDNYNVLYAELVTNLVHRNNRYRMAAGESPLFHNPIVTTYRCVDFLSEYNDYDGVQVAFYAKGSSGGVYNNGTCRYNITRNMAKNAFQAGEIDPTLGMLVHDNLSIGDYDWFVEDSAGSGARQNIILRNNTLIDLSNSVMYCKTPVGAYDNNAFRDNVVYSSVATSKLYQFELPGHAIFEVINYNLIHRTSGNWSVDDGATGYSTFAAWQSASSKDSNSTTSAPTFVNAGAEDYRLSSDTGSSTGGARGITTATLGVQA